MFSAIGHFVEKIRRVGYGPLVLDQEPGNFRELEPAELAKLRLAAEGKLRTPKAKEVRRRNLEDAGLPTVAPKPSRVRPAKPFEPRKPDPLSLIRPRSHAPPRRIPALPPVRRKEAFPHRLWACKACRKQRKIRRSISELRGKASKVR